MTTGGNNKDNRSHRSALAEQIGKRGPFEHPEVELYLNLIRSAEQLSEAFDALFKEHGISQTQYNALRILRGHGGPTPSGVVARQMVTREPDITRLLERLVKLGLIERERSSEDRRVMLARLTDAGAELLERLEAPVLELHRSQFAHLAESEIDDANALIERLRRERETD